MFKQGFLKDKIALVIGGTARDGHHSIGAAISHFLQQAGATVLPVSSNKDKVATTLKALGQTETLAEKLAVDVCDRHALKNMIDWVAAEYNQINILINAQGIGIKHPTTEMQHDDWMKILTVNAISVAEACQFVGAHMIKQGSGHIINITSETALKGFAGLAAYGMSKGAVKTLTEHLAVEWGRHGVCVNSIAPGWFLTDMNRSGLTNPASAKRYELIQSFTPAKRIGDEAFEDLRAPLYYLSSCTTYTNGQSLAVDGGYSISGSE